MAPKKLLSSSRSLRRRWRALPSSMRPALKIGVDRHLLAGHASRLKRAATSAMRPEPLVMTTKFTTTRMVNTITPMTKLPPITKLPKAWMTWPAAAVPSWPWLRIRRVEARLSASRSIVEISSTVGKAENSSGRSMNSADHQDEDRERDRERQADIEQPGRHRQDEHDQDRDDAERQRDLAALQRRADPGDDVGRDCGLGALAVMSAMAQSRRGEASSSRARAFGLARQRHGDAFLPVLLQLVAQGADRDAEDVRGMGAVAEAMVQASRG